MTDLLERCRSQQAWLLDTVESLVRLESPSTDKAALDRCGDALVQRLRDLGARVDVDPQTMAGNHVRAEFGDGRGQVLLLGHFDTVWPVGQLARMPCRREAGRLYGPGAFDMKAGIGIALLAARVLRDSGRPLRHRLAMLFTSDEETGSHTSRPLIEAEAGRSEAVLVLEPSLPGGAVKTQRKGCGVFELRVRGVSAHAGIDPGKGASAIHEIAHQIVALERLQDSGDGTSVNVGVVSGGTRSNVVAEEAQASIDVRVTTMTASARVEEMVRGLRPRLTGTVLDVSGGLNRPPMERTAGVARLYELARDVARGLDRDLGEGGTGGGSDGNFTAALGVPTLDGLGAVGDGAHAQHEHVEVDELPWRAALVAGLVARLSEVD